MSTGLKIGCLKNIVLVGIISLIFGCGGDPYGGRYTKVKPDSQRLVGGWLLKEWRMKGAQSNAMPEKPTKIAFQTNGSFTATDYPGQALGSVGIGKAFMNGEGNWSVAPHQNFWVIKIDWKMLDGNEVNYGQVIHLLNNNPPYILHHVIGDPDVGEALVFNKAE